MKKVILGVLLPIVCLAIVFTVLSLGVRKTPTERTASHVQITDGSHALHRDIVLTIDSVNHVYCYTLYQSAISCVSK